jgi:uncharacterized protein (TIGR02453 family)
MVFSVTTFAGFSPDLFDFLTVLRRNNSREWFAAHRDQYERVLLAPARAFVEAMGELLPRLGEDLHAEPKVHGSILAFNRDTRFSADKTPYKTHLDLWFWHAIDAGSNRERPGYFVRLEPERLILGAGMHAFSAEGVLERYRQAVLDPARGDKLEDATAQVGLEYVKGRTYSRVPRGLPAEHPRADWLRHSGLYAEETLEPLPPELFSNSTSASARLPEFCLAHFLKYRPVFLWLVDLLPG